MESMSPRERVFHILNHQLPDRMPVTLDVGAGDGIGGPYLDLFRAKTGCDDPAEYFDYDIRVVPAPLTATASDFTAYHAEIPAETEFDEFGVGRVKSNEFPLGLHLEPWKAFTSPQQLRDYPFPIFELADETVEGIRHVKDRGYIASVIGGSINESCYYLRSMEQFMLDLALQPEMAELVLDKVTALCVATGEQLASAGADIITFFGDVGGQRNMIMSPAMWRKWIKPRWETIFAAVRHANPETKILYHSCGYIMPIIPDFIELGLDILNPIQPEAMDPIQIKHEFGEHLTLWGGVGLQTTMRAASHDSVREDVRHLVTEWARGGGAIATVTNTLPLDIPWENVEAMVETVREFSPEAYARLA